MGSIRSRAGKLFFDFYYQSVRCREQTLLNDTKLNRARMEKVMNDIDRAICIERFVYSDYFLTASVVRPLLPSTSKSGRQLSSIRKPPSCYPMCRL